MKDRFSVVKIPDQVKWIIDTLEKQGYEAYAVGGCVRDTVLGREPGDWDITTSARPEQVKALFRRTIDTGIQHGTVTVMLEKEGYEITTYRMDGEYEDHRHPREVRFTPSLREDLRRRDFTINAMAYNPRTGIVDPFDGMSDIEKRCIRCVGDPRERFGEDALRMLRGIRFAGQLQFEIENETLTAIREQAPTLVNVSAERIRTELTKLLLSDGSDRLLLAAETGLDQYFLPELGEMLAVPQNNPHHCFDVGHHSMEAVRHINRMWHGDLTQQISREEKSHVILAFAALLHDVAKPDCRETDEEGVDHFYRHNELGAAKAEDILRRLRFDNETISLVVRIIRCHDRRHENCMKGGRYSTKGKSAMRRLMNQIGVDAMPYLFVLQRADLMAQGQYMREEKLLGLDAAERCYKEICKSREAVTRAELALGGKDLLAMGVPSGPEVGQILDELLNAVLEEPSCNTVETLTALAKEYIADHSRS